MAKLAFRVVLALLMGSAAKAAISLKRDAPDAVSEGVSTASDSGSQVASKAARTLPRVPEAPLPGVAGPPVPGVGSSQPHTADPVVCGLLGGVIVFNWILACCCAGCGAAGAADEASQGEATKAEEAGGCGAAVFACVECLASVCSIGALVYCIMTGLFRAWMGGQKVSGWCLALVVISTLQLLLCCCICCCASCGAAIIGDEMHDKYINKHSRHLFGSHLDQLVHKHKPTGSHPISQGHLPFAGEGKKTKESEKTRSDA